MELLTEKGNEGRYSQPATQRHTKKGNNVDTNKKEDIRRPRHNATRDIIKLRRKEVALLFGGFFQRKFRRPIRSNLVEFVAKKNKSLWRFDRFTGSKVGSPGQSAWLKPTKTSRANKKFKN